MGLLWGVCRKSCFETDGALTLLLPTLLRIPLLFPLFNLLEITSLCNCNLVNSPLDSILSQLLLQRILLRWWGNKCNKRGSRLLRCSLNKSSLCSDCGGFVALQTVSSVLFDVSQHFCVSLCCCWSLFCCFSCWRSCCWCCCFCLEYSTNPTIQL